MRQRITRLLSTTLLALPWSAAAMAQAPAGFPAVPTPPPGAPTVLIIMTDDVGFAASSTFGGGGIAAGGTYVLQVDGKSVREAQVEHTVPFR